MSADFDDYVRARLPHLIRFARALTADEHSAADLVQDALERTLVRWSHIDGDPEAYVQKVMVNRSISVWRKLRRERVTDQPPDSPTTDAVRDDALFEALRTLAPKQRAVIALRYYEDLSEAETAAVLGCTIGTVKSQTHHALVKLRTLLPAPQEAQS